MDPLSRFRDARDSSRWTDISAVMSAIKIDQVDNGGQYISDVATATATEVYMIGDGTAGCDDNPCDDTVSSDTHCIDLSGLVTEGYLGRIPVSPTGDSTWNASTTGYVLKKETTGAITVTACESENSDSITIVR